MASHLTLVVDNTRPVRPYDEDDVVQLLAELRNALIIPDGAA